jgi:putative DNA primase/helicase
LNLAQKIQLHEVGDAQVFAEMYEDKLVFDHDEERWYFFNGIIWERDKKKRVYQLVDNVAKAYENAMSSLGIQGNQMRFWYGRINRLRKVRGINSTLNLAQSYLPFTEKWDANPYLLAVENAVIDLRTGEGREGKPDDWLRTQSDVEWKGLNEPAPRFEQFLEEIFDGDTEIIEFIQRLFGYAITGLSVEHVLPILYGPEGRNGKDTLMKAIHNVLGNELVSPISKEVLLSGTRSPGASAPFLFELIGKRLVYADETSEGAGLDEGQIKMLTGGAPFIAKELYHQPVTVSPQYLILIMTNFKPKVNVDDPAIWERLCVVTFSQRFVENPKYDNEHKVDKFIDQKLEDEASGILAWLVRGCLEWQKRGSLDIPEKVRMDTEEYKDEQAILDNFLDQECYIDRTQKVQCSDLYDAIKEHSDGELNQRQIANKLRARGFYKKRETNGVFWHGLQFKQRKEDIIEELAEWNN